MKAKDVVLQLANLLPQQTDLFTSNVEVQSIVRSGTVMTVTCAQPHGLKPGNAVAIVGASVPIAISSFTRAADVGTVVTAADHDLTLPIAPTVLISGAVEPQFNGTFETRRVTNRRTIKIVMADSGPTVATGSPLLRNAESFLRKYDGTYSVLGTPAANVFTFEHSVVGLVNPIAPAGGTTAVRARPRISATATIDRAMLSYTEKDDGELWMFVVLEDVIASKERLLRSDAIANIGRGLEYRQQMIQPFEIFVVIPATASIAGREARDLAEDLYAAICRCVLFSKFDSGFYAGKQGTVHAVDHGRHSYDSATYVHRYRFEQVCDLTFNDSVGHDDDVAFRDIDLAIFPDLPGGAGTGIGKLEGTMDLDDEPL